MSHEASDDFAPDRDRVADADAAVPLRYSCMVTPLQAKWSSPR
jgi:hypothetical protein